MNTDIEPMCNVGCIQTEFHVVNGKYNKGFVYGFENFQVFAFIQIQYVKTYRQCECGKSNEISFGRKPHERIVGGIDYIPHKYPWLALLHLNGTFLCGGSIISDQYILSAAHCLSIRYEQSLLKVVLGEHNRCKPDIKTTIFSVTDVIIHRKFDPNKYSADIMLLKLSMKLDFNEFVRPICLPIFDITRNIVTRYGGRLAKVVGWGKKHPQSKNPSCLPQELQVPVLENEYCGSRLQYSLFCAGYVEGGYDSCQGDSGGPLQIQNRRNRYELIGVVSNGRGCALANHPGLYTDVLRYLPWIRHNTNIDVYCLQN